MAEPLYGVTAVARELRVLPTTLCNWRVRQPDTPEPTYEMDGVPLWDQKALKRWHIWHSTWQTGERPRKAKIGVYVWNATTYRWQLNKSFETQKQAEEWAESLQWKGRRVRVKEKGKWQRRGS